MWNVLKFFFVWFWLALAAFVVVVMIAPKPDPRIVSLQAQGVAVPQDVPGGVVGLVLGFTMCIPAYLIARPKSESPD